VGARNRQSSGGWIALAIVAAIAFLFGRSSNDPPAEADAAYSRDGASLSLAMPSDNTQDQTAVIATEPVEIPQTLYQPPPERAAITYFANCSQARAAGAAPVRVGDAGYASHLDRDNDGVGCE